MTFIVPEFDKADITKRLAHYFANNQNYQRPTT